MNNTINIRILTGFLLLTTILLVGLSSNNYNSKQNNSHTFCGLSIRLDSDKTDFLVYEDLIVNIILDNSQNNHKVITSDYKIHMYIVVKDENGEKARYQQGSSLDFHPMTDTIENQKILNYNILSNWGYEKFDSPNIGFYSYIPEGIYKIRAEFHYNDSCYYYSNELLVTVKNPTGIEKDALEMIRSIYKVNIMGSEEKTLLKLALNTAFFEKFSSTVYTTKFFKSSMMTREMQRKVLIDDAISDALLILEANQNNIELCELVIQKTSKYINNRANSDRKNEFLNSVMEKFPDSEAYVVSDKVLKGLLNDIKYYNY